MTTKLELYEQSVMRLKVFVELAVQNQETGQAKMDGLGAAVVKLLRAYGRKSHGLVDAVATIAEGVGDLMRWQSERIDDLSSAIEGAADYLNAKYDEEGEPSATEIDAAFSSALATPPTSGAPN